MILGIDTSCYTTSMILVDAGSSEIQFEKNVLLKVKEGSKGLRQSDGFFQHVHQLADSFEALTAIFDVEKIVAIAVSTRPRNVEGSYMPVFGAGYLFAKNLSNSLKIPLYEVSHQEGHLMAALATSGINSFPDRFYGLHLSGGTTECLVVDYQDMKFHVQLIGETLDLNFGQLIDRIGVKMGFAFPAGKALDELASKSDCQSYKPVKVDKMTFNISGLENYFSAKIGKEPNEDIAKEMFNTVGKILVKWTKQFVEPIPVIISGGVASNSIIRQMLTKTRSELYFAKPDYARDNAYGVALLGAGQFVRGKGGKSC